MSQLQFLELPKGAVVPLTKITPGLWVWKDDSKTLEFASAYPKEEPKEKARKGKSIHFQDTGQKTLERSTPSCFRDMFAIRTSTQEDKAPRPLKRVQADCITLEDVKYTALFLAHEDESFHVPSFSIVMRCKQLDDFLMALLYYISFYLEKLALEKKPRSFIGGNITLAVFLSKIPSKEFTRLLPSRTAGKPSSLEVKEMQDNQIRLAVTKKHLAEVYCILILGLGMAEQHHMACGKKKTSTARKDREFFECLYNFSSYVAFVTFKQKYLKEIQQEVGRLLRSNVFNPALREKSLPMDARKTDVSKGVVKKVAFPYQKNTEAKQPAIRSVIDQRSPVLRTLLPMAQDSAQYLFQKHYLPHGRTAPTIDLEDLPDLFSFVTEDRVGIIGAPRHKFNPHTLLPLGTLDEEDEDLESIGTKTSTSASSRETTGPSLRSSASTSILALSRATTEGDYNENPQ